MNKKLIFGATAVIVMAGAWLGFKNTKDKKPTIHPLEGRFIKAVGTNPIFKIVGGKPVHIKNPAEMNALMKQKYGAEQPWYYDEILKEELLAHFPELADSNLLKV